MIIQEGVGHELTRVVQEIALRAGFSSEPVRVEALAADGSERRFFRVRCLARHGVVLISPRQKQDGIDENDSYFAIGNHLYQRQVPVPRIFWADLNRGYFLLEDLGDFHLQTVARARGRDLSRVYRRAVRLLVGLHRKAADGFKADYCFDTPVYDPAFVYQRELEYFRERFLNGFLGLEIGPEDLRPDFEHLAEAAGQTSCSHVIHRDFQSRNILVCARELRIIDFQGMRFGPPAYDLASLLIDPYVGISPRLEQSALAWYWRRARGFLGGSFRDFRDGYGVLRLCRNLQILGAYGYLGLVKGKPHFLRYIPQAWRQLRYWISHVMGGRYPALRKLVMRVPPARTPVHGVGCEVR